MSSLKYDELNTETALGSLFNNFSSSGGGNEIVDFLVDSFCDDLAYC